MTLSADRRVLTVESLEMGASMKQTYVYDK